MPKVITKYFEIRVYGNLNDFLHHQLRHSSFKHGYTGNPSVKDIIEAIGIPHVEVSLILSQGVPVPFDFHPNEDDRISIYPRFKNIQIDMLNLIQGEPEVPRFILDVHLGKLARYLRILGFDTLYRTDYRDEEILHIAQIENRIILTRDLGILRNGMAKHGYFLRSVNPKEQIKEVVDNFSLSDKANPFSRCSICNGKIIEISQNAVHGKVKQGTFQYYKNFYQCDNCEQIYWEGSHFGRITAFIEKNLS